MHIQALQVARKESSGHCSKVDSCSGVKVREVGFADVAAGSFVRSITEAEAAERKAVQMSREPWEAPASIARRVGIAATQSEIDVVLLGSKHCKTSQCK